MKDDFNLEQVLGKIAAVLSGKGYRGVEEPLKILIKYTDDPDALDAFKSTVELAAEKGGAQEMLYMLHGLILLAPEKELQQWLVDKWQEVLAAAPAHSQDSITSYLGHAAGRMKEGDPLEKQVLSAWSAAVDPAELDDERDIKMALGVDKVTNARYRRMVFDKLSQLKDRKPDTVLKILTDILEKGGYYEFRDKDPASEAVLFGTIADILRNNRTRYDNEKTADAAWKVFVTGAGKNATAELSAAKIYMELAASEPDAAKRFSMYSNVIERRTASIYPESEKAAYRLLDLADTGVVLRQNHDDIIRTIADRIFHPAIAEMKNEDLASRAADSLIKMIRIRLSGPETSGDLIYYNTALQLLGYFEPADPRRPEVISLWKDGLIRDFKSGYNKDYFGRHAGAMLDIATRKGDAATANWARRQWREVMEAITKERPQDGYRTVRDIIVNAAHYGENSELVKEAQRLLPDYEKRAGIVRHPDTISMEDFKKLLQKKREPKPGP